ncbi:serine/threonine-protein kinase [Granulicoccus sp. GXG6511]|uniref:serine/threonine-protein kinase n=1 Tax=Granulicoccus sp. GXG6511 TaxID=3381351 RepID=UPI003D7DB085
MRRIADYEFVRELGSGNYGTYWVARTPPRLAVADEFCAVKVLAAQASGDAFKRMVNELKLFASAQSDCLVKLFDAGHEDGQLFYAAQYHPRGSLAEARGLTDEEVVRAVADAARGAHALHELGVAHRDIKPANILLTGSTPVAVLSDLGLAQRLSPGQTVTGLGPIGTLAFMEPGVARGLPAGRASDIWGLAATLQSALTGVDPFPALPGTSLVHALQHLLNTPPTVTIRDSRLAEIARRGMAEDRGDRWPTAGEFAEALEGTLR